MEKIKEELIGLNAKIIDSKNPQNINIEGRIVDETKNMIIIETDDGSYFGNRYRTNGNC